MTDNRLEYLLKKCKRQIIRERNAEARVWLEIALDEFPNNRELQRFAGKTYLQWGMTPKAIHFLEFDHSEDILEIPTECYNHDNVTQEDLAIIEDSFADTETSYFGGTSKKRKATTPVRKTLTLNKSVESSGAVKSEIDSICSSPSGDRQIVVKRFNTRRQSSTGDTIVENEDSEKINAKPPISDVVEEDRVTVLTQETSTFFEFPFAPVSEDCFNSEVTDELQEVTNDFVSNLHETIDLETTSFVLSDISTRPRLKQIENIELQTEPSVESDVDNLSQAFINNATNILHDVEKDWDSDQIFPVYDDPQPDSDELEWFDEPTSLALYQDDYGLLDFADEEYELFDVGDDLFLSALDDCDEDLEESSSTLDEVNDEFKTKLTRWERAQQVAVEVIYSTNWSGKYLAFLTDVFFENGWGATRIAIEKEIRSGTTVDELMLARDFKEIWKNNDRYWITFNKLGPTTNVTEATHRNMSWVQALKIIRCFNWLPSVDELEVFLENEFEYWYQHTLMRRVFPVFMKYLCYYRTKKTTYMDFELGPYGPLYNDDPMDNGDFINCNSEYRQRLRDIGFDSITATYACNTVRH